MSDPTLAQRTARQAVVGVCMAVCTMSLLALLAGMGEQWHLAAFGRNRIPASVLGSGLVLLLGVAVLLVESRPASAPRRKAGFALALAALALSLAVAAGHLSGRIPVQDAGLALGRPTSLLTCLAVALAAWSAALRWSGPGPGWRRRQAAALLAQVPLVLGTVVLVSYAAGAPLLYESAVTPMSMPSALGSVGLGLALTVAAGCDIWPLAVFGLAPESEEHLQSYWFTTGPLALFLLLSVLILSAGSFFLRSQLKATRARVHAELATIADFKAHQIAAWLGERRADAAQVGRATLVQDALRAFLARPLGAVPEPELRAWMEACQAETYRRVVLFDPAGRIRWAVPANPDCATSGADASEFQAALRGREVRIQDLHRHEGGSDIHLSLWVPIGGLPAGGPAEGVLLLQLDPQAYLFPLIRTWPTPSPSAETLLVRRDGDDILYLNEVRHRAHPAMGLRLPMASRPAMLAALAAQGGEGLMAGLDYRGEPVLAALHQVPGMPWGMVAKVDEAEVYGPLRRRVWWGGVGLLGLMVLVAAGLGLMVRHHDAGMTRRQLALSQRFEWLMREANDIIFILDAQGKIREANRRAVEHYGYSAAQLVGMFVMDLRSPETVAAAQAQFAELKLRGAIRFETLHQRADGTTFPVEVSARWICLEAEDLVVTFIRDITEHRTQQRELQRMTRLHAALSQVNLAIVRSANRDDLFQRVCQAMVEQGGFAMAWVGWREAGDGRVAVTARHGDRTGFLDRIIVRADHSPEGRGAVGTAIREACPCVVNDYLHAGESLPWREGLTEAGFAAIASFPIREGGEVRGALTVYAQERDFFGVHEAGLLEEAALDISFALDHLAGEARRREAERSLQESERFLREAEEAGRIGTYTWDIPGDHWKSSPFLDRIFGIGPEHPHTLEGWLHIVAPEDRERLQAYVAGIIQRREPFDLDYAIVRPSDGARRWLHGAGELQWDAEGRATALVGVIRDITELRKDEETRRNLEAQLHQAQKLESLGSLAGGVAHDMNNVLGAILGIASAQQEQLPGGDPMARALDTIVTACLRGRGVVKGLLCFARKELDETKPVELNVLARDMVQLLGHTTLQKIGFVLELQEDLPVISGDPGALSHALMNLCVNAMDAMPAGGTLTLRTRERDGAIELSVRDTGQGMSPETLAKATEPFFTTKAAGKGTGLGLSMVFGTMKAHGGSLELQSREGVGTEANLRFPKVAQAETTKVAEPSPLAAEQPRPLRILLVDDDELIRESLTLLLESVGHRVQTAPSGSDAIHYFQGGSDADVVILDMNMPGLSGAETLPRILALRPAQPVLMASGYSESDLEGLLASHPSVRSLAKPFTLRELQQKLEGMMPVPMGPARSDAVEGVLAGHHIPG